MRILKAAKIVIFDQEDNVLVLYRSETHPRQPHEQDLPGGIVKLGEDMEEALAREVMEETGLTTPPDKMTLVYTLTHDFFGRPVSRFLYAVRVEGIKPQVQLSWEHEKFEWLTLEALPKLEAPYQQGVDYAKEHNLFSDV